jgi:hypothetical protein
VGLTATRASGALIALSLAACSACGQSAERKQPAPPAESARPSGPGYFDPTRVAPPPPKAGDASGPAGTPALPPWVVSDDADEWIRKSFVLQPSYARAFVVGAGPALTEVEVPAPGASSRSGAKVKASVKVKVAGTFATIGEAIGEAKGGDVVAVRPGRYPGFVIADDSSMKDGAYLSIVALGKPGEVIVDRAAPADPSWMIYVRGGHHVVIDGLAILGTRDGKGPRGGIMIDGAFRTTGKLAHHVVVRNVWSDGHRKWGIHATDTRTVLVEDSFFTRSFEEHGVYVSDGSDDWTIRRNVFFSNNAGGLQINVDPLASFEEAIEHPRFAGHARHDGTRAWAELTLKRGDELFGANAWPDGRGYNFHVTQNVMNENGRIGGAAINLAAVSDSLFENNLVYGNQAGGIALWDNQNPYDEQAVDQPPLTAADAVPAKLPLFGCRNDRIRNNTVVLDGRRASIQCRNGSIGCTLANNLAINAGTGPGLEVFGTSMPGLDAWNNVIGKVEYSESTPALYAVVKMAPEKGGRTDVDAKTALAELENPSKVPWLRLDGPWPQIVPDPPSYRPKPGSALMRVGDAKRQPPIDLEGKPRGATTTVGALLPR